MNDSNTQAIKKLKKLIDDPHKNDDTFEKITHIIRYELN